MLLHFATNYTVLLPKKTFPGKNEMHSISSQSIRVKDERDPFNFKSRTCGESSNHTLFQSHTGLKYRQKIEDKSGKKKKPDYKKLRNDNRACHALKVSM